MKNSLIVLITCGMIVLVGCDTKKGSGNAAIDEITSANKQKQREMLDQLDSGEGLTGDTQHVRDMADKLDEAAIGLNATEAAILKDQAETLREIQLYVKPYEEALKSFVELGGLYVPSFDSAADFDPRIELVNQLIEINEVMDEEIPPLFRRLSEDPVQLAQKMGLISQLRQTDRDLFPHMLGYLQILRDNWDGVEVLADGDVSFLESVPVEVANEFNMHAQEIGLISDQQIALQRALISLDQP